MNDSSEEVRKQSLVCLHEIIKLVGIEESIKTLKPLI